jgi:hypothetical protein
MGIMANRFAVHERAPHRPNRCIVTSTTGSPENPLIDLDKQIDYYGMVYLSYSVLVAIADQFGFATPQEADRLRLENAAYKEKLARIPAVTENLVNDIRNLSISASADLLAEPTPVVLADDPKPEQINGGANQDYFGDDTPVEPSSEPVVDEGPDSVPAGAGSKRTAKASPRAGTPSN